MPFLHDMREWTLAFLVLFVFLNVGLECLAADVCEHVARGITAISTLGLPEGLTEHCEAWVVGLSTQEGAAELGLALVVEGESTIYGTRWSLRLRSGMGDLRGSKSVGTTVELKTVDRIRSDHHYAATIAYDPISGEISVGLLDLDTDLLLYSGIWYIPKRSCILYPYMGVIKGSSGLSSVSLDVFDEYRRARVLTDLALLSASFGEFSTVLWNEPMVCDLLVPDCAYFPGKFKLILDMPASMRGIELWETDTTGGTFSIDMGKQALPPGSYEASLYYCDNDLSEVVRKIGWNVVAPNLDIDIEMPYGETGLHGRQKVYGKLTLSPNQNVADVQIKLTLGNKTLLEFWEVDLSKGENEISFESLLDLDTVLPTQILAIEIRSRNLMENIKEEHQWPLTVTTRFSGDEVLANTLFDLTVSSFPSNSKMAMKTTFYSPGGGKINVDGRSVFRSGFGSSWNLHIVPTEPGLWKYQVHLDDGNEKTIVEKGAFDVISLGDGLGVSVGTKGKAPFKVLYTNDTTQVTTCISPYRSPGEEFKEHMLVESVKELANTGVDVQILQPGTGWVPWWKSKLLPYDEHFAWYKDKYGVTKDGGFADYLLNGGDLIDTFVRTVHQIGQKAFVSFRLNDAHGLEQVGQGNSVTLRHVSRFYEEYPEYRIGDSKILDSTDERRWAERVQDWTIPAVRAYKLSLIRELCENYDFDGLELDFMRHPYLFDLEKTTLQERVKIVTDFVSQVRAILDYSSEPDKKRWLSVRIPAYIAAHGALGISLAELDRVGVDIINASCMYFTEQQTDVARIVGQVSSGVAVYLEMTHCTRTGPPTGQYQQYDDFTFRRTTDEQFYTTAYQAYEGGADGISLFNFVYYREHGAPGRGPFDEPPFHVIENLRNLPWLAQQPQYYFLADVWNSPSLLSRPLPRTLVPSKKALWWLSLSEPDSGWRHEGRIRIQSSESIANTLFTVTLNGIALDETRDVSEPYDSPYAACLGTLSQYKAWIIPLGILKDGMNRIEIKHETGASSKLVWMELVVW